MNAFKKVMSAILCVLIVLTIAFIFYNSSLPPDKSGEQSGAVSSIIAEIFPPGSFVGDLLQKHLRKLAHFAEYGLLGIQAALLILVCSKRRLSHSICSIFGALTVAFTDETVQIFSGRAPSVTDIWIDLSGYAFFMILTFLLAGFVYLVFVKPSLYKEPRHILIPKGKR